MSVEQNLFGIIGKQLGAYTGISQYNLLAHNASLALT